MNVKLLNNSQNKLKKMNKINLTCTKI